MEKCFEDETGFVSRMISTWEPCLRPENVRYDVSWHLASNTFRVLLEAASIRPGIWRTFISNPESAGAIERLLLADVRPQLRGAVGQTMVNIIHTDTR